MTTDNRLIFRNTFILYSRLIITSVIGLFTTRLVFQALGVSNFGLYSVLGGIVVMMAFLNSVMVSTTYRYIAFEMGKGEKGEVNEVFNISLVIHLCMAVLMILFTETIGVYYVKYYLNVENSKLSDALFVLRFSTYAEAISIVSIPYQGLVTAQEKFGARASIEIIRSVLMFLIALTISKFIGNKLRLYVVLITFINIVPAASFYFYCRQKYHELIKWKFKQDKEKYKEMFSFSGWIMIGAAASVGQTTGSSLIINFFFGTVLNAAFGIANQVNNVVLMFARNLGQAATPQIIKSFSSGNNDRMTNLAAYISKYSTFLMLLPALPILLETRYLLTLWLGKIPPYTVIFCQLIIINALISGLSGGLVQVIQATGKIKIFQIFLSTISLLNLPIAYALFSLGYPPYSIFITFISTALVNIIIWQVLLRRVIQFDIIYYIKTAYLRIGLVTVTISPLFFLKDILTGSLHRFIMITLLSIGWLLVAMYVVGLEKKEKLILVKALSKIKTKILKKMG